MKTNKLIIAILIILFLAACSQTSKVSVLFDTEPRRAFVGVPDIEISVGTRVEVRLMAPPRNYYGCTNYSCGEQTDYNNYTFQSVWSSENTAVAYTSEGNTYPNYGMYVTAVSPGTTQICAEHYGESDCGTFRVKE